MKLSVNQFLAHCEKTNDPIAEHITSSFIETMRMCNPHMKHMTGSDWLLVLINDYSIVVDEDERGNTDIQLVPND